MTEILQEFRAEAPVGAIEGNLFAVWTALGRTPGAELYEDGKSLRVTTGIPLPICNGVLRARFAEEEADAQIEAAIGHFRSRGVPFLQSNWHTSSNSRRALRGKSPAGSP
jgi:hypothetical protein